MRNLRNWNKTLNLRLIWLLFDRRESLWVAWNHFHRLQHANFWNVVPVPNQSWIWKALLSMRPLAKRFLRCKIGDGRTATYWFDNWSRLGPLKDYIGIAGPHLTGIQENSTIVDGCSGNCWILPSSRTRNEKLADLRNVLLLSPPPRSDSGPDSYIWYIEGSTSKEFSTKATWEQLREREDIKSWSNVVWFKGCIPKHAYTFWVAQLNRLPVMARLAS